MTRPAARLFERLVSEGKQTVRALTDYAGVSQPAVSKHLGVLKLVGLVRDRSRSRFGPSVLAGWISLQVIGDGMGCPTRIARKQAVRSPDTPRPP